MNNYPGYEGSAIIKKLEKVIKSTLVVNIAYDFACPFSYIGHCKINNAEQGFDWMTDGAVTFERTYYPYLVPNYSEAEIPEHGVIVDTYDWDAVIEEA